MNKSKLAVFFERATLIGVYGCIWFIPFGNAGIEISLGLAGFFFILRKIVNPDFAFLRTRLYVFLALFLGFSILSLCNSGPYLKISVSALLFKWLEYALVFVIVGDVFTDRKRIRIAIRIMLAASALVGIDAIFQQASGFDLFLSKHPIIKDGRPYLTACFNHHNDFGAYISFMLVLILALLQEKGIVKALRAGLILLAGVAAYGLLFSLSRGAWLGFLFSGIMLAGFSRHRRLLAGVAAILLFFLFSSVSFWERVLFTFGPRGDNSRFVIWQTTLDMIHRHPWFGSGVGTFMARFSQYGTHMKIQYAHNGYLQILAETGLFGLIGFLGFLSCLMRNGWKALRVQRDVYLVGLFCALVGFLVHGFFDTNFYSLRLSALFWSSAALLSNLSGLISVGNTTKSAKA